MSSDLEKPVQQEFIDNDNEPTDEEIREYAKYLGFNLEEDEDLIYIAKEGLKAPLPPGWRASQNDDNEVYYCNTDTKDSQWEHPLDDFYREKYQHARAKKKTPAGLVGKSSAIDKKPLAPVSAPKTSSKLEPLQSLTQQHLPPVKNTALAPRIDNVMGKGAGRMQGYNLEEAIIEEEHTEEEKRDSDGSFLHEGGFGHSNKGSGQFNVASNEFEMKKKQEIDREFEEKKREIDAMYEQKLKDAIDNMTREKEEEKARISGEMSKKVREQEEFELRKYEDDLKRKLKDEYDGKYKEAKGKYEGEIAQFRSKIVKENEKKLDDYKNELSKQFQSEIAELEKQLEDLKAKNSQERAYSPSKDPIVAEIEGQKVKFREEQEKLYQKEIERYNKELQSNLEKRKEAEIKKFNDMFQEFCRNYEKSKQVEKETEIKKYEAELEKEYNQKIEAYKKEIEQQIALTKQVTDGQMREAGSAKKAAYKAEVEREYGKLGQAAIDERGAMQQIHEDEMKKLEKELETELQNYKNTVIKNYDLEIQDLEKHISEKRKKIIGDANKMTEEEFLKHEDTVRLYPDLIQIYKHIQSLRQEIAKKDLALKSEKENQLALKNELAGLNEELGRLKAALKEKEYKSTIEPLRQLEETLLSKLKQKEQMLSNIQVNRSTTSNPPQAGHFTQPVSTVSKGVVGGVQLPASQQNFYAGSKYTIQTQGAPLQTYSGHSGNEQAVAGNGSGNQTIEKLYSEIKELKTLISKQQPGVSGAPGSSGMSEANREVMRNVLKTNAVAGKK